MRRGKSDPSGAAVVLFSGRGTIWKGPAFIGTTAMVADQREAWLTGRACDGFVLPATPMRGACKDFSRLVLPERQRSCLFQKEYRGTMLRENQDLPRPPAAGRRRSEDQP